MGVKEVDFKKDIDRPSHVLEAAKREDMQTVIVVGRLSDGELYVAGSTDSLAHANLMLDHAKLFILEGV